jgi:ADP-heptose:LPS heptosyltransferase
LTAGSRAPEPARPELGHGGLLRTAHSLRRSGIGIGRRLSSAALELAVATAARLSPALPAVPRVPRSIFVLRNNDIGDLLVVTPLFAALRHRFPEAWIAAGVGSWNLPVLHHNPHLSEVLTINAPWFNKYQGDSGARRRLLYLWRSAELGELARRNFDLGIDVLGSGWGSLLMLRGRIHHRLGVRGYAGGHSAAQATVPFDPAEHVGRAALRFAEILGATNLPPVRPQLFLTGEESAAAGLWWAAGEAGARRPRVVIAPGGGLAARCWPAESFIRLATDLAGLGNLSILALGGPTPGEGELVARVAAAARGRCHEQAPGLREAFALVAASDLVVCNSSMLLHVAAAFAKPTLVLLGGAFPSARRHQAQWGYAGTCRSLGREPGAGDRLCTVDEALECVREEIRALPAPR